jgi:RES domain-containing protein
LISRSRLERILASLAGSAQRGTFFRSIDFRWLLQGTPLSAVGSRLHGGRYNANGTFEAFYLADSQASALYETEAIFNVGGVVVGVRQPPRVMLSLDYDLQCLVDLRERAVLDSLGVTVGDLQQPWKMAQAESRPVLTQRIGAAARAADIEGLLVPSARVRAAANLVVFPDRLRAGSRIELYVGGESVILPRYAVEGRYRPNPRRR